MHATKRPRTLLLASRSLPCSSSDAATTPPDAAVACRINADQSLATPPRHARHQTTTNLAAGQPQLAMLELGRRHHAAGRRCSMQNQCRSIVSDATTPCTPPNDHEPCCWPAAACHARARTPPPRRRTPL
ncbi:hypothetical protein PF001_g15066 [Phytophthora fragariae]|uniref:Uncharacterized protein n=4 Tax=Phytophthora fragariae TaxID=53985 RepID=A0A6A4D185_9STRA|nr:hypothetical protein PF001_g15066 [Phytophthora fragariae]